ncbi:hypothetical protein [Shewanella baltica]|uniref:hypothetical protein n=1 Tax=Shewanella baltica TaxID=62322 RepID=UPI00217E8437|nr:hypothetical protein [Shewanella baltica]MCS6123845.1 hypothetical protein [Shewanella baltica]
MSEKWIEIEEILSGLIGDLTIAVTVLKDYEAKSFLHEPQHQTKRQCIWRLCVYSIVINCRKYVELNKKYGREFQVLIPEYNHIRGIFNDVINKNSSIKKLRNHCVAHVSDKSNYLKPSEVQAEIIKMFNGHFADEFLDWICPDNINSTDKTDSLVGVIELLRDAVSAKL